MPVNFVLSLPTRTLVICVSFMHFKNAFETLYLAFRLRMMLCKRIR